jgi:hypothetical protein
MASASSGTLCQFRNLYRRPYRETIIMTRGNSHRSLTYCDPINRPRHSLESGCVYFSNIPHISFDLFHRSRITTSRHYAVLKPYVGCIDVATSSSSQCTATCSTTPNATRSTPHDEISHEQRRSPFRRGRKKSSPPCRNAFTAADIFRHVCPCDGL